MRDSLPRPPVRFPPGIAGKRRKPWLRRQAILRRTLREIVDLAPAHLPEVVDLWVASWARTMPEIDFEARRPWLVGRLAELAAADVRRRVAFSETGEAMGFVTLDPANGWLDQIAVGPDFWGCGVAERLLDDARAIAPGRIGLDVNADNSRAVAFYEKQGFVKVGTGANPRSGLPTLILEWRRPT
ncbi:MAG: GNAT family N-acetyltransferase [Phyllobacteriaceae bacterium]|nr:GNAT family N-acetyltransferase [Phyllobacteriaceae bacterium]